MFENKTSVLCIGNIDHNRKMMYMNESPVFYFDCRKVCKIVDSETEVILVVSGT